MGKFNSKVEKIESLTASWNGSCSTFEGPLYYNITLNIPTCFDTQGTTFREPNQSSTVAYVCSEL